MTWAQVQELDNNSSPPATCQSHKIAAIHKQQWSNQYPDGRNSCSTFFLIQEAASVRYTSQEGRKDDRNFHFMLTCLFTCFLLDADYKKFLEFYNGDEEKFPSNPETLLEEIEAKTKELSGEFRHKSMEAYFH